MSRVIAVLPAMLLAVAPLTPAAAEKLGSRARTAVFMETIIQRGAECDLLAPWQAAALRAQMAHETMALKESVREKVRAAVAEKAASTPCDSASLTGWIDAAAPNMETEMLPPHLLVYRALTERDPAPAFLADSLKAAEKAGVLEAVETRIADYAASGKKFEGGKPWPAYAERTLSQIEGVIATATDDEGASPRMDAETAQAMLLHAVEVATLWSAGQGDAQ